MLTASQIKYGVLGKLSAARQKIQYRNFRPTCGDDAVVHGIDDQVAYLTRLLDRGNMEMFLKRLDELMFKLLYGPLRGRALFVPELDELVRRANDIITTRPSSPAGFKTLLHITTQVYPWGGHTRVIEDIAASLPEYRHELIVTGMQETHRDFSRAKPRLDELRLNIHLLRGLTRAKRALEVSSLVSEIAPDAIFLSAFPDDAAGHAGVATQPTRRILFLHAGDHHVSLGASRDDYIHVDLTPACHNFCLARHQARPLMLNLTVRESSTVKLICRDPMVGATCGSPHKYAGSTEFSYAQLLAALFSAGVGEIFHIGDVPEEQRNQIRAEIVANAQDARRIVFLPNTPSLAAKLIDLSPDFYLVSHPVAGGKATVEALSVGLPILHARPASGLPLLTGDMTFGVSVIMHSLEEAAPAVFRLRAEAGTLADRSRAAYEKHYSPAAFREGLLSAIAIHQETGATIGEER